MKIDIEWVTTAQDALIESGIVSNGSYPQAFKGYISSLAATIAQMGLIPALKNFENDNKDCYQEKQVDNNKDDSQEEQADNNRKTQADNNRAHLIHALYYILLKKDILKSNTNNQIDVYYINKALVALKLAIRLYKKDETKKLQNAVASFQPLSDRCITPKRLNYQVNHTNQKNMGNLGYLFYRDMYQSDTDDLKRKISNICSSCLDKTKTFNISEKNLANMQQFFLKTTYPGLLIGAGITHGLKNEEDIKIGFLFDHTSGLPYIPGSSIKGVLRSVFPTNENDDSRVNYLNGILSKILKKEEFKYDYSDYCKLEKKLFEGSGNDMVIYFDAFISESKNTDGRFLGNDYITPHKEALKEPVPIQFLKVLPDVVFQFQFRIPPQFAYKDLRYKNIEDLFKKILIDLGIGAKTNVGYGHFLEYNDSQSQD